MIDVMTSESLSAGPAAPPLLHGVPEAVDDVGVVLHLIAPSGIVPGASISASRFAIEAGCGTREDRHAVHEVWFVAQGSLQIFYDGLWCQASQGSAVYFAPWKAHCARNIGKGSALIFSVWWQ